MWTYRYYRTVDAGMVSKWLEVISKKSDNSGLVLRVYTLKEIDDESKPKRKSKKS